MAFALRPITHVYCITCFILTRISSYTKGN